MCFMQTLNTNISMQYGEPVPQGKPNSSLEVVNFSWINVSGYDFNMNIYYMNLQPVQFRKKLPVLYLSINIFKTAC